MTIRNFTREFVEPHAPGIVVVASTFFAIARWIKYSPSYTIDGWEYLQAARYISQGNYFALDNGFRTPLFPLFLACAGNNPRIMFAGHLLLGIMVSALVFQIFKLVTGRPAIGVAVAILYNLNPSTVAFETMDQTETLTTFFVTLGTFFAVRTCCRRAGPVSGLFLSSLAFSLASLTRPEYQLLPLVVTAGVVILGARTERPRWALRPTLHAVAAGLIPFFVLIVGWSEINYARFGWFTLSTSTGYHLTQYSGPYLQEAPPQYGELTSIFLRHEDILLRQHGTHIDTFWLARPELAKATGLTDAQISRLFLRMSLPIILRHPGGYFTLVKRSVQVFWRPPIYARGCNLGDFRKGLRAVLARRASWWDRFFAYLYLPFEYAYALALVGPALRKRWRPLLWSRGVLMVNTVIIYTAVITSLLEPEDNNRFKMPVESLILGVAVIFLYLIVFKSLRLHASALRSISGGNSAAA